MNSTIKTLSILVILITITALPATAEWSHDYTENNPVCVWDGEQYDPRTASDGTGGVFVTWQDSRTDDGDIYAQHLDAEGNPLWAIGGVPVCLASGEQLTPHIQGDTAAGAFVVWKDGRSDAGDIYVQHLDAAGNALMAADGVPLGPTAEEQTGVRMTSDGAGGVIIAWEDWSWWNWDIRAQRFDAGGTAQWPAEGLMVCVESSDQFELALTGDDAGGAIIAWLDARNGIDNVYAQRVNAAGTVLWTYDGVPVCTDEGAQYGIDIIPDGAGGAFVSWCDFRAPELVDRPDAFAQRIDHTGTPLWTADGVVVCDEVESQWYPRMVADGAGGIVVAWEDWRWLNPDIRAQKLDSSGTPQWDTGGVMICVEPESQQRHFLETDGAGGAIIAWQDYRIVGGTSIYAQRVGNDGYVQWAPDGITVSAADYGQRFPVISSDENGGVIVAWKDWRNLAIADIYAQQVDGNGLLGGPTSPPSMVGASLTCVPEAGAVPFSTWMTLSLENLSTSFTRCIAGRIDIHLASGTGYFPNWRAGFTNIDPGSSYNASWPVNIPALGSMIGANRFELHAMDVTPLPYNVFPFPPSGTTDSDYCVVYGIAP